jgi:Helix-turn-helix domain
MSVKAMAWAYEQQCGSPAAKLVLVTLCDYANDQNGLCAWPSQAQIADKCEMSDRHLRTIVAGLVERGFLKVEHRFDEDGRQRSSLYRICMDRVEPQFQGRWNPSSDRTLT